MLCANAAGQKCKLLVVCKSANTQAFKDVTDLPVIYKDNKNGSLTQNLIQKCFFQNFTAEVKENYCKKGLPEDSKTVLLIDPL